MDDTDELLFVFLQRKGNPHDIVFASQAGPRLHHAAFSVPDSAHLLKACDIAGLHGFGNNLEAGPGRHGPGHALYCYFRDPDGHRLELFTTHYQVMDIENEPVRWNLSQLRNRPWGFPPRRRWYEEAMLFDGVPVEEPAQKGQSDDAGALPRRESVALSVPALNQAPAPLLVCHDPRSESRFPLFGGPRYPSRP